MQSKTTSHTSRVKSNEMPLPADPALLSVAAELLRCGVEAEEVAAVIQGTSPALLPVLGADYVALAAPAAGRWSVVADSGLAKPLPIELLAEALDREAARADSDWVAAPLAPVRKRPKSWRSTWLHAPTKAHGLQPVGVPGEQVEAALAAIEQLAPVFHLALGGRPPPRRPSSAGSAAWRRS